MSLGPTAQNALKAVLQGITGDLDITRQTAVRDSFEQAQNDWRVKISLAPNATYLYKDPAASILKPLSDTGGVIFPYTPQIQMNYAANYDATDITHSNYKIFQYRNSAIDGITITGTFTAQDTAEANYMLAVIHFFRSVTKMFYGQDSDPRLGTPPPVCYLSGYGTFQFNNHPMVINSFNYNLPDKVDYIRAQVISPGDPTNDASQGNKSTDDKGKTKTPGALQQLARLGLQLLPGGSAPPPVFSPPKPGKFADATYVPTEMQIIINAYPIVSRNDISNNFSLSKYATGELTRGGIW